MRFRLLALLVANSLSILSTWLLGPIYATFLDTLRGSVFAAGASWGLMAFVSAGVMLVSGRVIDEGSYQVAALIAGYVVLGGGSVGFLLSEHVYHVFVAQAVNGVGMGLVQPSWKALYAREQDAGREVRQWGWADGTSQVITGVGSVVGGTVVSFFSFDVMFVLMAVVQWCAAGMVVWYAQS